MAVIGDQVGSVHTMVRMAMVGVWGAPLWTVIEGEIHDRVQLAGLGVGRP